MIKLAENIFDSPEMKTTRDGFGEGLVKLGEINKNVVVLCGDVTESVRARDFADRYPERFFEIGVAEQNMMGIAAGLALSGKIPFATSYAVFNPGRSWDQLRVSVCYSQANVKVVGAHAGISVGPDGATHQALEDIAITRVLPNLTVVVPCDAIEAKKATLAIAQDIVGPVYLRIGREKSPIVTTDETPFTIGKAEVFREGKDVTIIACGIMVYEALAAAETLARGGTEAEVINCHTVKPLDRQTLIASVSKTGCLVTAEEHQTAGGLGSAVIEVVSRFHPVPVEMVGVKDTFGESGTAAELVEKYGLKASNITKAAKEVAGRKNGGKI